MRRVLRGGTASPLTPEDLLDMITSLRNGRSLDEMLRARGASFLASNPDFRTVRPSVDRDQAFPYVYNGGHNLIAKISPLWTWRMCSHRSPLVAVGVRGSGKTMLLLRALDIFPRAQPKLDLARVYITFDSTTATPLRPGGRNCFRAAVLLRVFHAVLATLDLNVPFETFLSSVDWQKFSSEGYLPRLAKALGVKTLAIAVDEFASGVRAHMPSGAAAADVHAQTEKELGRMFVYWGALHPNEPKVTKETPAAVVPLVSCAFPRYVRAAVMATSHMACRLWVDLAPCVDDMINQAEPSRRPHLAKCFRELFYRQEYAACGGHFQLCATVYAAVDRQAPRVVVREALQRQIGSLACELPPRGPQFATMMVQAVIGMTFEQLQCRHGDAALPLDPFFQQHDSASDLPLAVALSPDVCGHSSFSVASPLTKAFHLWKDAAEGALQRQTTDEGMRKAFGAVIVHGLALRWAAFLVPPGLRRAALLRPPALRHIEGPGAFAVKGACLDTDGKLRWIDLSNVDVREPCKHVAADTFPPHDSIALSTYSLVTAPTNAIVEGIGCVAVRGPSGHRYPYLIAVAERMYFTVQLKPLDTASARAYVRDFKRLITKMPGDEVPCLHFFFTPQQSVPDLKTVKSFLKRLRAARGLGTGSDPRDVVACVSVEDCLTPSLAWTFACAGFAPGFKNSRL
jgi:hypothetical protein